MSGRAEITVLIATYNRAELLARTLDTLASTRASRRWEVLVVDNNSSDCTRGVVQRRATVYPVPLRYLFERRQGKSIALNSGIAGTASELIAFTDDDVRVPLTWLESITAPLFARNDVDYTGGPVRPLWECPMPDWLDESGNLGGTIAIKDHGAETFIFEEKVRTPLGVNMCVRRSLLERLGGFHAGLGRNGQSLLGQEQAEFFCRSRAAGARGLYVPTAWLQHFVPAQRLTRGYFARWWFWKGVSQSRLHSIQPVTELGLDLTRTPHVLRVPRFVYGSALRHVAGWVVSIGRRDQKNVMRHAMGVAYCLGYAWGRRQRTSPPSLSSSKASV